MFTPALICHTFVYFFLVSDRCGFMFSSTQLNREEFLKRTAFSRGLLELCLKDK